MSYLYKRSNLLWPWLIRSGVTHAAWCPLVELSRLRHVRFRRRLETCTLASPARAEAVVAAGV